MKLVYTYYIIQTNIIQGASYMKNYKKTKLACYLGFITQAIAANLICTQNSGHIFIS